MAHASSAQPATWLVTGASSGFGWAIAEHAAKNGARVILSGRRTERLQALADALKPAESLVLPLDVRDRAAVFSAIDTLPAAWQTIDVLVNNAGLALGAEPAPRADLDDWERMIDTNIKGLTYCTQAVLRGMVARGRGHVVNIGSIAGSYAYRGGNVYGGTKAFVEQFSTNLRADLLGTPIRVTNIEPGMAETEFSLVRYHGDAQKAGAVYQGIAALTANDVAEAVLWAASRPAHVNINRIELMPTQQASGGLAVSRKS